MQLVNSLLVRKEIILFCFIRSQLDILCAVVLQTESSTGCIDSSTKSRTNDTLFSTSVSIVIQNVGLIIHWS